MLASTALVSPAWASVTLTGIVVQDRLKGPAVAGMPVSALGATPTLSRSDGSFGLNFPDGHAGQDVSVRAGDKDWAVVNEEALDTRLPDATSALRFHLIIVVASPARRQQRRAELFGLVVREAAERSYRKQSADLQAKAQLTEQQRTQEQQRLERELEQAKALADYWAQKAAQAKPEDTAGLYGRALTLFTQGQSEQALKLLSDEALEQEAHEAQDKQRQNVLSWQLKAQVLVTKLDFDGAIKAHEQATRLAPGSIDAWFGYAYFQQQRNAFQAARRGYERTLVLARDANDPDQVARLLNNLGVLSSDENRNDDARHQYEEALKTYRQLAQDNPALYLPDVAMLLNNLGVLSRTENRNNEARRQYEEALKIRRQLAQNDRVYLPDVATTLNNLGVLSSDENRKDEARRQFEEALELYRQLAKEKPALYLPRMATMLNNLGIVGRDENRYGEARRQYEEALSVYRQIGRAHV